MRVVEISIACAFFLLSTVLFRHIFVLYYPRSLKLGGLLLKTKSHLLLGKYIVGGIGTHARKTQRWAFVFGCVEPDYNYLTYLRGSFSNRMFSGHTFESTAEYICEAIMRLEARVHFRYRDYYRLGKLIHYVVDAFTYAHNRNFPGSLPDHRSYEMELKEKFAAYLAERKANAVPAMKPLFEALVDEHARYMKMPASQQKDMNFVERVACMLFSQLTPVAA